MVFEEDIEAATQLAIRIVGPQGRMLEASKGVTMNAILGTKTLGKIWYGDVGSEDTKAIIKLAEELKEEVVFIPSE